MASHYLNQWWPSSLMHVCKVDMNVLSENILIIVNDVLIYRWYISHKAPFCNRNVHMCAHFCYKVVHCGIFVWCIVGFVQQVYWSIPNNNKPKQSINHVRNPLECTLSWFFLEEIVLQQGPKVSLPRKVNSVLIKLWTNYSRLLFITGRPWIFHTYFWGVTW